MKKCAVFLCCFCLAVVGAAVWFSPLCFVGGEVHVYENNAPVQTIGGAAYLSGSAVRVDFDGDMDDLLAALDGMSAREAARIELDDGLTIIYAYSPRVCAGALELSGGGAYNVMAACRGGHVAIGAPVLEGSY